MRWQPFAVAAMLAAPPVALLGVVWPSSAEPAGGGGAGVGDPEEELSAGDVAEAATNGVSSTDFLITGEGDLRIDITGPAFDPTLTLVDPDTGEQLDFNDDSNGLDPSLTVDLGDGGSVLAQVRSLGGPPGGPFTIAVEQVGGRAPAAEGAAGDGSVEPFTVPIGDEPIVIEGPGGVIITLREDGPNVCFEVQSPNSGSGTCGSSLADLAQFSGFSGSGDGRTSTLDIATLVGPEVAEAVVVFGDDNERRLDLLPIPGRVEQVVVGQVRVGGDAFARPGGAGILFQLRDSDGEVLESHPG